MNEELAEKFAELARKVIKKASSVECSIAHYVDGLELIVGELNVAIEAGKSGLKSEKPETD